MKRKMITALLNLILIFIHVGNAVAGITPPPCKVLYEAADYSAGNIQWLWEKTYYGGCGQEPMLEVQASLDWLSGLGYTTQEVDASFGWDHKIEALSDLPADLTDVLIPYKFQIRIEGTATGGRFVYVSASVRNQGGSGFLSGSSISFSQTYSGLAKIGEIIPTHMQATVRLTNSNSDPAASEAQIIVDPFIFIDPGWEFASYFSVYQQPGPDDPGWMPVTRDWMTPVPVPAAVWLFGSGLLGLIGVARRKRVKYERFSSAP